MAGNVRLEMIIGDPTHVAEPRSIAHSFVVVTHTSCPKSGIASVDRCWIFQTCKCIVPEVFMVYVFAFVSRYVVVARAVFRTGADEPAFIVYVFHCQNCDAAISYKWNFCSSVLLISTQVYAHAVSSRTEPEPQRSVACSRFGTEVSVFVIIYVTIKFDVV